MNKIFIIIKREYLTRVRKRLFIITTILTPLALGLIFVLPVLFSTATTETKKILVSDEKGIFKNKLENKDHLEFSYSDIKFDALKKVFKEKGYTGILHIPADYNMYEPADGVEYYSDQQLGFSAQAGIEDEMTEIIRNMKYKALSENIDDNMIKEIAKSVSVNTIVASEKGEHQGNMVIASGFGMVMGGIIYIVMFIYGGMVMRGVLEEKNNRIAEVIISSVKPFEMMMGKIIGIALVGLTQIVLWVVLLVAIYGILGTVFSHQLQEIQAARMNTMMPGAQMQMQQQMQGMQAFGSVRDSISTLNIPLLLFSFFFYFLGGYFIYASLFAAVGAATGDEPDASLNMIITIPVIISFFIMVNVPDNPNSTLATVASIFPLTSPIVMTGRMPFDPPVWQIVLSMGLLILGFILIVWLAAKIYRTGILMYGKKNNIRQVVKWLFYKYN